MTGKPVTPPVCPACNVPARLTTGMEVYPHRPDIAGKSFWVCPECGARCGCHPGTSRPLGTPAGPELRRARSLLHDRMIDPLWRGEKDHRHKARGRVYRFLSCKMGIDAKECHTGLFTLEQCRAAWRALRGVTMAEIIKWNAEGKS